MELISSLIIGIIISYPLKNKEIKTDKVTSKIISFLLFLMGLNIGIIVIDDITILKKIFIPIIFTLFMFFVFTIIFLFFELFDKNKDKVRGKVSFKLEKKEMINIGISVLQVALGAMVCVFLHETGMAVIKKELISLALNWTLILLLFVVGIDIGDHLIKHRLKGIKPLYLIIPFLNIILSLLCGIGFFYLLGDSVKDGLLVSSGMGWYSLSSVIISEKGLILLSIYSFIHNLSREIFTIILSPLLSKISPMLLISLGGATSMDVMLPFVKKYCGPSYTLVSFYSGTVLSISVPIVIELIFAK